MKNFRRIVTIGDDITVEEIEHETDDVKSEGLTSLEAMKLQAWDELVNFAELEDLSLHAQRGLLRGMAGKLHKERAVEDEAEVAGNFLDTQLRAAWDQVVNAIGESSLRNQPTVEQQDAINYCIDKALVLNDLVGAVGISIGDGDEASQLLAVRVQLTSLLKHGAWLEELCKECELVYPESIDEWYRFVVNHHKLMKKRASRKRHEWAAEEGDLPHAEGCECVVCCPPLLQRALDGAASVAAADNYVEGLTDRELKTGVVDGE